MILQKKIREGQARADAAAAECQNNKVFARQSKGNRNVFKKEKYSDILAVQRSPTAMLNRATQNSSEHGIIQATDQLLSCLHVPEGSKA